MDLRASGETEREREKAKRRNVYKKTERKEESERKKVQRNEFGEMKNRQTRQERKNCRLCYYPSERREGKRERDEMVEQ